jgi:hypothetical protein
MRKRRFLRKPVLIARSLAALAPRPLRLAAILLATLSITGVLGCSQPRPVLYPNATYERVGRTQAERDVDFCLDRARAFLNSSGGSSATGEPLVRNTVAGAATGAAVGAVAGAVSGDAGRGAKVGAATGAAAGFTGTVLRGSSGRRVDPVFANFVERCLRERGYEPIGWR